MKSLKPRDLKLPELHALLLGAIAPRPIAFASTIDKDGNPNLSPFSFFNVFSSNPPVAIFSPARKGKDGTSKHTLDNLHEVPEVCINVVNFEMVQQTSLSSTEYPKGINEFVKSGFTQEPSLLIKPFRVKESPVQFECKVREIIALGTQGGSGNLVIVEILMMHLNENILDERNQIDPNKIDLVGRLGGDWYNRANGNSLFKVPKPLATMGIGVDALPDSVRNSNILSGNDLGLLGNLEMMPGNEEISLFKEKNLKSFSSTPDNESEFRNKIHNFAKEKIKEGKVNEALLTLLSIENN